MKSFCSIAEISITLDQDNLRYNSFELPEVYVFPTAVLWKILSYLSPSVIFTTEEHFCSPRHPCCRAAPTIRAFLPLRLVCHSFNLICRVLGRQYGLRDYWTDPIPNPDDWGSLQNIIYGMHIEGRYRHFYDLNYYEEDGRSHLYSRHYTV